MIDDAWKLTEPQIRAKAIELLDMCNAARMDAWIYSGVTAGVLDADLLAHVLIDEIPRRARDVQVYWGGGRNRRGLMN